MPSLIVMNGTHQGVELGLHAGRNTLGRAEDNDFVLPEPTISSHHCELEVGENSIHLRDLDSTNGTSLDGEAVRDTDLSDGQVLKLGDIAMRVAMRPAEVEPRPLHLEADARPKTLEDGRLACLHHPAVAAVYSCPECHQAFCAGCVREVHLVGRSVRHFCPKCSAPCRLLPGMAPPVRKKRDHGLWETIRIGLSWKRPKH